VSAVLWALVATAVIAGGAWFVRKVAPYYQDEEPLLGRHHESAPDADGEQASPDQDGA
jgi:hypothetical protein